MKSILKIGILFCAVLVMVSCADKNNRNYQYMPNMYFPVGYETYQQVNFLPSGTEAMQPADNTISRGWLPYEFANDLEGKDMARLQPSPLDSLNARGQFGYRAKNYMTFIALSAMEPMEPVRGLWLKGKRSLVFPVMQMQPEIYL